MNKWLDKSIAIANNEDYLDRLSIVYPMVEGAPRIVPNDLITEIIYKMENECQIGELFDSCAKLELFPIKDSYVAFLKKDKEAKTRNPKTVKRTEERIRDLGVDKLKERIMAPKETNRQIGPMFRNWLRKEDFSIPLLKEKDFKNFDGNAIFDGSDENMKRFAIENIAYEGGKGLDFLARIKNNYIIGEAKFLTDHGGHQNAQLNDALKVIDSSATAIKIAILDGVCYLKDNNKMHTTLTYQKDEVNIMSSLLLKNFLSSIA